MIRRNSARSSGRADAHRGLRRSGGRTCSPRPFRTLWPDRRGTESYLDASPQAACAGIGICRSSFSPVLTSRQFSPAGIPEAAASACTQPVDASPSADCPAMWVRAAPGNHLPRRCYPRDLESFSRTPLVAAAPSPSCLSGAVDPACSCVSVHAWACSRLPGAAEPLLGSAPATSR
jgi:hypothetical protein